MPCKVPHIIIMSIGNFNLWSFMPVYKLNVIIRNLQSKFWGGLNRQRLFYLEELLWTYLPKQSLSINTNIDKKQKTTNYFRNCNKILWKFNSLVPQLEIKNSWYFLPNSHLSSISSYSAEIFNGANLNIF